MSDNYMDLIKSESARLYGINGLEHLFLSWAKMISRMDAKNQIEIKSIIRQYIDNA